VGIECPPVYAEHLAIAPTVPSTLFVCLQDKIFKSTDGGMSWTVLYDGPNTPVSIWIDPTTLTTLYASTDGSFLKSTDGGSKWVALNTGLDYNQTPVTSLAIDPTVPTTLYLGTNGHGLLKSTDGGKSWTAMSRDRSLSSQSSIPPLLQEKGYYGYNQTSENHTSFFDPAPMTLSLMHDPLALTTLYAGTRAKGVLKSTDGGKSWTPMNEGWHGDGIDVLHLAIASTTPATFYAIASISLFKRTNDTARWIPTDNGLPPYGITALTIDPKEPTTLYVVISLAGLYKSIDGGTSWTAINKGLPRYIESRVEGTNLYVEDVAIDPKTTTNLYAIASSNGGAALFKSTDGGAEWIYGNLGHH